MTTSMPAATAPTMTDDERRLLREHFIPSCLLDALKEYDALRDTFKDRDGARPPEIRNKLLRLYALASEVINRGEDGNARECFALAAALNDELSRAAGSLERIQRTLSRLAECAPESLL